MKRKVYLRHNKRSGCPSLYVAFDCETRPVAQQYGATVNVLQLGVAIFWRMEGAMQSRREVFHFIRPAQFLAWLESKTQASKRLYVWCHNAGFDLTAAQVWSRLDSRLWRPNWRRNGPPGADQEERQEEERTAMLVIDDPPTILDLRTQAGHRITFVDLLNWLPFKAGQIGDWVGCPKLPMPGDEADDDAWAEYCQRDAEIVERAVCEIHRMVKECDLGNLRYTVGGQSMALYQHRCREGDVCFVDDDEVKRSERNAYCGMPATCYFVGTAGWGGSPYEGAPGGDGVAVRHVETEQVTRLDMNSCYPSVMAENWYPVEYLFAAESPSLFDVQSALSAHCVIAEVIIDSDSVAYPLREGDQVRWVTGRFPSFLCGPELESAVRAGHVASVVRMQLYRQAKPFGQFCSAVWQGGATAKKQGNVLRERLWKAIGVALHGKFAQRSSRWVPDPVECPPIDWGTYTVDRGEGMEIESWRSLGGVASKQTSGAEYLSTLPAIAAYVCSYARCSIRRAIRIAGPRNVFYWDTDSIHVGLAGVAALHEAGLLHHSAPGRWKIAEQAISAEWRGPKNYRIGDVWTIAGVTDRTKIDAKGICHDTRFLGLESMLHGPPPSGPMTNEIEYCLPAGTPRELIGADGWTRPRRITYGG